MRTGLRDLVFGGASLIALVLFGCAAPSAAVNRRFAFTASRPAAASQPGQCQVQFVSTPPGQDKFEEIGTIRQTSGGAPVGGYTADTMSEIVPEVCSAGGQLVWTELSGMGFLVRGVVYRVIAATAR